jgi:hypothetical protein
MDDIQTRTEWCSNIVRKPSLVAISIDNILSKDRVKVTTLSDGYPLLLPGWTTYLLVTERRLNIVDESMTYPLYFDKRRTAL